MHPSKSKIFSALNFHSYLKLNRTEKEILNIQLKRVFFFEHIFLYSSFSIIWMIRWNKKWKIKKKEIHSNGRKRNWFRATKKKEEEKINHKKGICVRYFRSILLKWCFKSFRHFTFLRAIFILFSFHLFKCKCICIWLKKKIRI